MPTTSGNSSWGEDDFRSLLSAEDWSELNHRIKSCYTINLISTFEAIKFADAMKFLEAQQEIARTLFDLLYCSDAIQMHIPAQREQRFRMNVNTHSGST